MKTRSIMRAGLMAILTGYALFVPAWAADPVAVRIAISTRAAAAPWLVAESRGTLEQAGIAVSLLLTPGAGDRLDALDDGNTDLVMLTVEQLLEPSAAGLDLRAVLLQSTSTHGDALVVPADIRSARDLRNKRIGVQTDSAGTLLLQLALQRQGLRSNVVVTDTLPEGTITDELANADFGGFLLHGTELALARSQSDTRVLLDASAEPGSIIDALVANSDWADNNKEPLKNVIRLWERTLGWMQRHPEESAALIAERNSVGVDVAKSALDGIELHTVANNMTLLRGFFQKRIQEIRKISTASLRPSGATAGAANSYLSMAALRQVAAGR